MPPQEADRLVGALRTHRDRAMLLAGLRRCEVLGLRFQDVQVADRGWPWWRARRASPGGPAGNRFFDALGGYLHERPDTAGTDRVL